MSFKAFKVTLSPNTIPEFTCMGDQSVSQSVSQWWWWSVGLLCSLICHFIIEPYTVSVNLSLPTKACACEHVSTVCVHACVHCWYFTCFKAYEVVWLSMKPHLNRTIADSLAPVMRLFVRALFLWNGCRIFLWINQLGSICIHGNPSFFMQVLEQIIEAELFTQ